MNLKTFRNYCFLLFVACIISIFLVSKLSWIVGGIYYALFAMGFYLFCRNHEGKKPWEIAAEEKKARGRKHARHKKKSKAKTQTSLDDSTYLEDAIVEWELQLSVLFVVPFNLMMWHVFSPINQAEVAAYCRCPLTNEYLVCFVTIVEIILIAMFLESILKKEAKPVLKMIGVFAVSVGILLICRGSHIVVTEDECRAYFVVRNEVYQLREMESFEYVEMYDIPFGKHSYKWTSTHLYWEDGFVRFWPYKFKLTDAAKAQYRDEYEFLRYLFLEKYKDLSE